MVPVHNGTAYLPAFFSSLDAALPPGSQVIIVDDGSKERVFDVIPDMANAIEVVRLRHESDLGYAFTVNRGLVAATGDVVMQLNSDLVLLPATITAMLETLQREKDVGIVGSKLVYPTTGLIQHIGMAFGDYSNRIVYAELPSSHPLCCRTREVQILAGATVAMSRRVVNELGPLDEGYFNGNEDLDYCMRALDIGLRNIVCADSVAYHWESQSGATRIARIEMSDARFWAKWGHAYKVDLHRFVDEALDYVLDVAPHLADMPFDVLDISRGGDQPIVLERLAARWSGVADRVREHRQMGNPARKLWLPMLVPHWLASLPTPFVYLVDHHRELDENFLWFRNRANVVQEELIVDLTGSAVLASELFPPDPQ